MVKLARKVVHHISAVASRRPQMCGPHELRLIKVWLHGVPLDPKIHIAPRWKRTVISHPLYVSQDARVEKHLIRIA